MRYYCLFFIVRGGIRTNSVIQKIKCKNLNKSENNNPKKPKQKATSKLGLNNKYESDPLYSLPSFDQKLKGKDKIRSYIN